MKEAAKKEDSQDVAYLEIWKIEQTHSRTRWTVTTFFLGISFAILGTSFEAATEVFSIFGSTILNLSDFQRITGLLVYWFGYILFMQFNRYTSFLRNQMRKMEKEELVSFSIQREADKFMYAGTKAKFSAKWLLFYFGLIYTAIVLFMVIR